MLEIFRATFPNIPIATVATLLKNQLSDCETVLDVGCGSNSPLRLIGKKKKTVGIDGYAPSIKESKKNGLHSEYVQMDVRDIEKKFHAGQFDAVVGIDIIEHLKKKEGYKLLEQMQKVAKKKVIIITPNGFLPQVSKDNLLQEHLSGWSVQDFQTKGYVVYGIYGLKLFRKEEAELRFKPKIISGLLAEISHHAYTRYYPKKSFALFAVYTHTTK
jgi:2-polyprenyl-3-methyl-5-hydroxy-6-metoxy-1,4-benzoquinol methylase